MSANVSDEEIFRKSQEVREKAERLDAKILFHHRNEKGELIPVEQEIRWGNQSATILVTPITRGEFRELFGPQIGSTTPDQDRILILRHLKDPAVDEKTVEDIRLDVWNSIVSAILEASGLSVAQSGQKKQTEN